MVTNPVPLTATPVFQFLRLKILGLSLTPLFTDQPYQIHLKIWWALSSKQIQSPLTSVNHPHHITLGSLQLPPNLSFTFDPCPLKSVHSNQRDLGKHKSEYIFPLFYTTEWISTPLRTKLKVFPEACQEVPTVSISDLVGHSAPATLPYLMFLEWPQEVISLPPSSGGQILPLNCCFVPN